MIEPHAEHLITIDELRTWIPHLRARQTSLRGRLDAPDAPLTDRKPAFQIVGKKAAAALEPSPRLEGTIGWLCERPHMSRTG
jgi:hypothetical protein